MVKAPVPADEAQRLQALQDLKILDSPPEERFDRVTRLAAKLFNVPIAYISLVDRDRQWLKSKQGLSVQQTARDVSFYGHAILSDEVFVVPDARADERFSDNPLVTGEPNVRFYAGIPLKTADGHRVGTLCVVDRVPRHFDAPDQSILRDLAEIVEGELKITRLREAAELLRETEERMQAVLDNSSAVIYIKDFEGRYILVNRQFESLFHVSRDQVAGKTDYEIVCPEMAERFRENDLKVMRTGAPLRIEEQVPHDDGVHTYISTKFLLKTPAGAPYAVCGLAYDITDRKVMEEELRQRAALQRAILDSANVTIISTSPDGMIRTFNRAAEKKLGYLREEVVGKTTPVLIHDPEEVRRRAIELAQELGADIKPGFEVFVARPRLGLADEREWTYIRKDGSRFPVLLSVTALRDRDGNITGFMGVGIDITERKEVERMKNEFISLVSHELRTPLTSIRGALGLVSGGVLGEIPAEARTMIDIANEDTERLVRLISGILDIEKIEAGKMDFQMEPLDLVALIRQVIDTNRSFARQSRVELVFTSDVPQAVVRADADRIIQVLTNLISNAIKFSPEESTIRLSVSRTERGYRVSVKDQGPGVPEEFRSRVFQKFAQADSSASREGGGSGLGLSISRAIVEKHGGQIGFETATGAGSTFFFDLPEAT